MWAYWPILGAHTALSFIFSKTFAINKRKRRWKKWKVRKWKVKFKAVCQEGTPYITGDLFTVFVVLRPQSII